VLLERLDSWAARGIARALVVKVVVTVAGPPVVLAWSAMLVLPGPGLVVMAAGLALLALEYPWARRVLALLGRGSPGAVSSSSRRARPAYAGCSASR
jgi:hypothetical protein